MPKGPLIDWTDDRVEFIRANYKRMTYREIAVTLGLRVDAVRVKAQKLGLRKNPVIRWTDEEIGRLVRLRQSHTIDEISKIMGRPREGIRDRLKKLGCVKIPRRDMSEADQDRIRSSREHSTHAELAQQLGRHPQVVSQWCSRNGIKQHGMTTIQNKATKAGWPKGTTLAEWAMLQRIAGSGMRTRFDLAEEHDLNPKYVYRVLHRMHKKGFLGRTRVGRCYAYFVLPEVIERYLNDKNNT